MKHPDTSSEVQKIYDEKVRSFSEQERFMRGLSLTNFCRKLCASGIRDQHPNISDQNLKIELFKRIYGQAFPPHEKSKIIDWLNNLDKGG